MCSFLLFLLCSLIPHTHLPVVLHGALPCDHHPSVCFCWFNLIAFCSAVLCKSWPNGYHHYICNTVCHMQGHFFGQWKGGPDHKTIRIIVSPCHVSSALYLVSPGYFGLLFVCTPDFHPDHELLFAGTCTWHVWWPMTDWWLMLSQGISLGCEAYFHIVLCW